MFVKVEKLEEAGYYASMIGLALNKNKDAQNMPQVAKKLAPLDLGHNKFMEHQELWFLVTAPRYWWQDADTYRLSSKQSQSTNHTIMKGYLIKEDFEDGEIDQEYLDKLNDLIKINTYESFLKLKQKLPEGFLQTREWKFSYQTLRRMILQRRNHKLPHWPEFLRQCIAECGHPEFLPSLTIPPTSSIEDQLKESKELLKKCCGLTKYEHSYDELHNQVLKFVGV